MAKTTGLGDQLYVGGYDVSGDIGSIQKIRGGPKALDVTGISQSAYDRTGGLRDGEFAFTAWFNPAANQEHAAFSTLPTSDVLVTYFNGAAIGNAAACQVSKQVDYNPTRSADGALSEQIQALANAYGLEWGRQLTAGMRTDTAATQGTSLDHGASSAFGGQAYLQVSAFTGTDVTVVVEDSANNSTFAAVTGLTFTATTAAHTWQRLATANNATIRQYTRVTTTTSGGFTSVTFAVVLCRNSVAGVVF